MKKQKISPTSIHNTLCAVLFLFAATGQLLSQSNTGKKVPVLELTGTAYERGLQHGTQLKGEIAAVFTRWKANMSRSGAVHSDSLTRDFLAATRFEEAIKKHTPELLDEVKGIAVGSGQTYTDVFAFQLLDEFWIYLDAKRNENRHHCSGMGVAARDGRPAYIAQNMDVENYMQGGQVLLHIAASKNEPEQYIISCAGLIALNGMNAAGIGMCMNTIMELQASANGLPVAYIVRGVLRHRKGKEAIDFLHNVKHASGQNYILGIEDSVYDFEASSNKLVRFIPAGGNASVVYHTNHALANDDVKPWYKNLFERNRAGQNASDNSVVRQASLQENLGKEQAGIAPDLIKHTLRSKDNPYHPVCRVYREGGFGFTFSSIIFTLGGQRSVQLTNGSPDQSEYVVHYFKEK